MSVSPKTVCFFGLYDPEYSRTRVLTRGFRENGFTVISCRVDPRRFSGLSKFKELYREYIKIRKENVSLVVVAFPGHSVVWLARLLFRVPIVFDAFVSLYDSNVQDRRVYGPWNPRALKDALLDWLSVHIATRVLMDTNEHCAYYAKRYGVRRSKFIRVLVGTDDGIFYPREVTHAPTFTLHFHGRYTPLQGVSYILDAAKILESESIHFQLVGDGQERTAMEAKAHELQLRNVTFLPEVSLAMLPDFIASAHVCLGIFGASAKTQRVIPNKVYECLAMGKPVITANTPAIRELSQDMPVLMTCSAADGASLAAAILTLYRDEALQKQLAVAASALSRKLQPEALIATLLNDLTLC